MVNSGAGFRLHVTRGGDWALGVPADFDYESREDVEAAAALTAAASRLAARNGPCLTHDPQASKMGA